MSNQNIKKIRETRIIMGMPVTLEIVDENVRPENLEKVFAYFHAVDEKFSTYKETSEISAINRGELKLEQASNEMQEIFSLAEETKKLTNGYFDIKHTGKIDPSGIVKGWAIYNAAKILRADGFKNFYVDVAGDIEVAGKNSEGKDWSIGIRDPFSQKNLIVKTVYLKDCGIATSGTYLQGEHIYNPLGSIEGDTEKNNLISLSVIGPNVYEADRFATAAFAMGASGIEFIEQLPGFEGYAIDKGGQAVMTSGFNNYTKQNA